MSAVVSCGSGLWLALVLPGVADTTATVARRPRAGRARRLGDRCAATHARRLALRAASLPLSALTLSVSHSDGAGMALVAPRPIRIGADVMRGSRVGLRHARAIASAAEIELLARVAGVHAPALAWTIKEAVYKATSAPLQRSLTAGRIVSCDASGAVVRCTRSAETCFSVRWMVREGFVAAWALARDGPPA